MNRKGLYLFAVLFLVLCLLPFVGMLWMDDAPTSDQDSRATLPALQVGDGTFNLNFLQGMGDYFEDHFAFRSLAIDTNARLRAGLFKTSPTDQVIVGREGWLFYGSTLSDFQATEPLSSREIQNITHNLSLMQGYTNAMGADFVVAIAPNKNTLYPDYMPYYYLRGNHESMELLEASLAAESINYVDLFGLFGTRDELLYMRTDTHWTTEGALLVTNALLTACDKDAVTTASEPVETLVEGDLERMLYPVTAGTEESLAISTGNWQFSGGSESVEDDITTTTSSGGEGSLLMFRDSFANTLIPYLATEFSRAEFSKMIPYNLTRLADLKPDVLIIERAERHLSLLGENPPFMYAPTTTFEHIAPYEPYGWTDRSETERWPSWENTDNYLDWFVDGDFRVIEGYLDEAFFEVIEESDGGQSISYSQDIIFVSLEGRQGDPVIYVPFLISIAKVPTNPDSDTLTTPLSATPASSASPSPLDSSTQSTQNSQYGFRIFLDERTLTEKEYTIKIMVAPSGSNAASVVKTGTLKK